MVNHWPAPMSAIGAPLADLWRITGDLTILWPHLAYLLTRGVPYQIIAPKLILTNFIKINLFHFWPIPVTFFNVVGQSDAAGPAGQGSARVDQGLLTPG